MSRRCCASECDVSLLMGWCPKRSAAGAVKGGEHPGARSAQPELPLERAPWPLPDPLLSWAGKAAPGERFTYFSGYLANTPSAAELGRAARQLREAGYVLLFQKRTGPDEFDYIAERRGGAGHG